MTSCFVYRFLATCERTGTRSIDKIFDLACGHGLVGIMLAYAYPDRTVMACDRKRRESFEAFNAAFAHFADLEETSPSDFHTSDTTTPVESVDGALKPQLANLTFVEGELDVLSPHVDSASLVLALHGCNEANKESMRMGKFILTLVWAINLTSCFVYSCG